MDITEQNALYFWSMMIIICSFIGFMIETIWISARFGYIDNRNMNLPFLLGYGMAVFLIYEILGVPGRQPDFMYFTGVFFMVSIGEIILGKFMEKVCGIYYWDYSALPLHFTRYTSLFTSLGFSILITGFMRNIYPRIANILVENVSLGIKVASYIGITALVADYFYSFLYMKKHKSFYNKWIYVIGIRKKEVKKKSLST